MHCTTPTIFSEMHCTTPTSFSEMHCTTPTNISEMHCTTPTDFSEMHCTAQHQLTSVYTIHSLKTVHKTPAACPMLQFAGQLIRITGHFHASRHPASVRAACAIRVGHNRQIPNIHSITEYPHHLLYKYIHYSLHTICAPWSFHNTTVCPRHFLQQGIISTREDGMDAYGHVCISTWFASGMGHTDF